MLGKNDYEHQIYMRLSILALLIAFSLTGLALLWKQSAIENDLAQKARTALAEANLPSVNVHFQGRDGNISGILTQETSLEAILEIVSGIQGVRTVTNQVTLAPAIPAVSQTDQPKPTEIAPGSLYIPSKKHALEQFDLSKIEFVPTQAILTEESYPILDQLAELLKQYPQALVEISAHTDNQGTALGQTALTQAKAEAVLQYLLTKGLDLNRIKAQGYGSTRPVASNEDEAGRTRNRRVELTVLKE
ncbi:OmpA family protein [uncultured Thiothrix sp.]|uniref:OmpA family protein n=1 Tax=uncultured Thiothrix sp. TaxID=223185 RepID=UPI00261B78DE|nr:OmpA family protein [uncultured Thiothrix sp.]